jgi:hypothetical protein
LVFAVSSRCLRGVFAVSSRCLRGVFAVSSRWFGGGFAWGWLGRFAWVGMLGARRLSQQQDSGTRTARNDRDVLSDWGPSPRDSSTLLLTETPPVVATTLGSGE